MDAIARYIDAGPILAAIEARGGTCHFVSRVPRSAFLEHRCELAGAPFLAVTIDPPFMRGEVVLLTTRGTADATCRRIDGREALRLAALWLKHRRPGEVDVGGAWAPAPAPTEAIPSYGRAVA